MTLLAPRPIPWRIDVRLREVTEVLGTLLLLMPALVRAAASGSDALTQGASVLALGAVTVGLGIWSGRRALIGAAGTMLALASVIALKDTPATEPYVAAAGVAILIFVVAIPRFIARPLPVAYEVAIEVLGAAMIVSGSLDRTLRGGDVHAARALAEGIALVATGLALHRRALPAAGLATLAAVAMWIIGDPTTRQFHGIVGGAALVAISIAAVRYAPGLLDDRVLLGSELLGGLLFIGPTMLARWRAEFFPSTVVVFLEIALTLTAGIVFRRRWLIAGALAATGIEGVRGLIDVVNRLPNWALFGGSGAILLAAGFVLLLKREAWNAWSQRVYQWWAGL
jgi:hypothetical protein